MISPLAKETSVYQSLWLHLNQAQIEPYHLISDYPTLPFSECQSFFASEKQPRVINVRTLSPEDEVCLIDLGISVEVVRRNLGLNVSPKLYSARAFQAKAVKEKFVYAICPITHKLLISNQSLLANINVIFYRFVSNKVFYLVTGCIGSGFEKCALYFPDCETVLTTGEDWGFHEADVAELKARMVGNSLLSYQYIAQDCSEGRQTAVCLGYYHFAHHLWNELSGIHRLHKDGLLSSVDKFLVTREPLGKIEQIFPEIPEDRVTRKEDTSELFVEVLKQKYFVIKIGDDFISRDLSTRVYRVAQANCLPETQPEINDFRGRHTPIVWIGIRLGNRTWADQASGLANLLRSLQERFPRMGVVFDGFSLPADRACKAEDDDDFASIVSRESNVVTEVLDRFQDRGDGIGVVSLIGKSIFDANLWAHNIDFYLSPYGTLQHKVGWLANKPGLIHTNQTISKNPPKYVWAAVEGAIKPHYASTASISDVPLQQHAEFAYNGISDARESGAGIHAVNQRVRQTPESSNYSVEWRELLAGLIRLSERNRLDVMFSHFQVANTMKRAFRNAIYALTARFAL